jgi:iron complex outermembrane receptor protein
MTSDTSSRALALAVAALLSANLPVAALAQETGRTTPAPGAEAPANANSIESILVTGTAIRGVAPVGSATVTLDMDQILEAGVRDAAAIVAKLPQGSGLGTAQNSTGGRQQGVNLRGLGNNATLILFDGHRWVPQGVINQVADPSVIPFAALERVEVVTDGASAIYGSDAVAGVVNYVFRKDYDGADISARATHTLYDEFNIAGVAGKTFADGSNLMLAFQALTRDSVKRSERDYLRLDLRRYGGNDNRLVGTTVYPDLTPALIIGNTVYGLPANLNGRTPTAAEVRPLQNNPSLYDTADIFDYFASRKQYSVLARYDRTFFDAANVSITSNWNRRENSARAEEAGAMARLGIALDPTSPYYIAGMPAGAQTLVYNLTLNYADRELDQENKEDTWNTTVALDLPLFKDFNLSSYGTYGWTDGCNVCQPQVNSVVAGIITRDRAASFNPYLAGPQAGAENLIGGFLQEATIKMFDTGHKIDGALFDVPGGAVRAALGVEYTNYDFHLVAQNKLNLTNTFQVSRNAASTRDVRSAFAETVIPIVGSSNAVTGMQRLDLNGAVRYDDYSDAGSSVNPKVGLTWKPLQGLSVRSSWGTSFRAPTLIESNPGTVGQTNRVFVSNGANDPAIPITLPATQQSAVLSRTGNTANLDPEEATVWSVGMDLSPTFLPGFEASITYYDVDYKDRIEPLPNQALAISSGANRELYRDFFIVAPQPATCVNGNYATYNPAYLPFLNNPYTVFSPSTINDCSLTGIINGGTQNLGNVKQSGLDLTADYRHDTGIGRFTFSGAYSKILNLQKSLTSTGPLFDAVDRYGFQVSERGRFSVGFKRGPVTANLAANYLGSYLNNATITVAGVRKPDTRIPSWTTFDATVGYSVAADSGGFLGGTRLNLIVQNLTDKDPPIVLVGTNGIDANNHNIFGRISSLEITKKF